MNDFDILVGRINEGYRAIWENINPLTQPQEGPNLRSVLLEATQAVSYSRGLYQPLEDYIREHPGSGSPIRTNDNTRWSTDTWLLRYDRFEYGGNVYVWAPEVVLTSTDERFDTFFTLKWRSIDVIQTDAFLSFHQQQGHWEDKANFVRYLRKLTIKHRDFLPSPEFSELLEGYTKLTEPDQVAAETVAGLKSIKIKLPKVPPRRKDDDKTTLSLKETLRLFDYLRQTGAILKDTSYLRESNVHKAIQVLTGYNDTNMRKAEITASISREELKNLRKLINRICTLIDIDLESKKGYKK